MTAQIQSDMPDVVLSDVHKYYGENHIVKGVSFEIGKGEFFSLLGPSGCGKTTILRMVAGFVFPDSGEVYIGGKAMGQSPPYLRETNMIFQQLALFPHMTVFGNVAYGLRLKKVPPEEVRRRVEEALALVRLEGYGNRRIHQLSGGQQQRVAIARAIVCRPRVLLLDEPLGALDLQLRLELQTELKRIQRETNTTFVFVTHDQGEAMHLSDKIAIIHGGQLVQMGAPEEIYRRPRNMFVARFIGETNLLPGTVESAVGDLHRVRLATGDVTHAVASGPVSPGADVHVSIRHELTRLGSAAEEAENRFTATVRNVIFRGPYTTYQLALPGGAVISAQVPNGEGHTGYPPGETVTVGWSSSNATLLPS